MESSGEIQTEPTLDHVGTIEQIDRPAIAFQAKKNRASMFERIAKHDRQAAAECLDAYGNYVWAIAKRSTQSEREAGELSSDIFSELWRCAPNFDPEVFTEKVFVSLIARHCLKQREK